MKDILLFATAISDRHIQTGAKGSGLDCRLLQLQYDLRSSYNVIQAALELSALEPGQIPRLLDVVRAQPEHIAAMIEDYCAAVGKDEHRSGVTAITRQKYHGD